ncbi:MAG TPA: SRPBCC domain-containing protein [Steroidobacteraceae bacterium]|nr:SRPBCC domain-containing protein [Steroidobacteraceae bacterium]
MATRTRGYAHRVDIAAPASRVWTALIEPKLLSRWMGPGARVRPKVGGSFVVTLEPGIQREASIDVFEPGRRLRLIFLPPPGFPEYDGAIVDDYLLEKEGEATIVRLLGSGLPEGGPWDPYYVKLRSNSERSLARLKLLLERKIKAGEIA